MADENNLMALGLGALFIGSMIALDKMNKEEHFEGQSYPKYPQNPMFYQQSQARANAQFAQSNGMQSNVQSNNAYAGPIGAMPQVQANINLNSSGDQLLAYQLYQQAVNAATPTKQQLDSISGESQMQTGNDSPLQGGVSSVYSPYNMLGSAGPDMYSSEFQAVNIGNPRAEAISACAQNAPTFVATSLLPKPNVPGQDSWDISAPQDILATQNFLSATQQMGVDTVLSSLRNGSYDIRNNIPNPINVVSPFLQSTITPDLERRPLDTYIPTGGIYGCGPNDCGTDSNYVGMQYN
jgi:hypothetical protein